MIRDEAENEPRARSRKLADPHGQSWKPGIPGTRAVRHENTKFTFDPVTNRRGPCRGRRCGDGTPVLDENGAPPCFAPAGALRRRRIWTGVERRP